MLLCLVCLFDLACLLSFFFPSSLINTCIHTSYHTLDTNVHILPYIRYQRIHSVHVPACSHGPPDEDGLASELVVNGDQRVVGRESSRGALAMHQQIPLLPVQHVAMSQDNKTICNALSKV